MNLAVGLTGLLLRGRNALPIALTAVLVEGALLITLDLDRLPTLTTSSEVLYPLYALAIAAASIGCLKIIHATSTMRTEPRPDQMA